MIYGNNITFTGYCEPGENAEVRRAKGFIRDLFVVSMNNYTYVRTLHVV